MRRTNNRGRILLLLTINTLVCSVSGQYAGFHFQRPLEGIPEGWQRVVLPDEIFGRLRPDLGDLRVIGLTAAGDTIEAPYLLHVHAEQRRSEREPLRLLNQARGRSGFSYTFEAGPERMINRIMLDFADDNFDRQVQLEGSQDQQEWFAVLENYRILSIRNELTDYTFTTLAFPDAKFRFFRLTIPGDDRLRLRTAQSDHTVLTPGEFRTYAIRSMERREDRQGKQTVIEISLPLPLPVSRVRLKVHNGFDYYRPMEVLTAIDSTVTQQGTQYSYRTVLSGTVSSLEPDQYAFPGTIMQRLQILIRNQDNEPLPIDSVIVAGNPHELWVRISRPADYFLWYGNPLASPPDYDLARFPDKIPTEMPLVTIGPEKDISIPGRSPLFTDKKWLWAAMIAIIALLGWFTVRLMRQ